MYLVDKQHVIFRKICQKSRKVAGLFNGRTGGYADIYSHFVGDDSGQSGLSQSRRTVQQNVVERLAALFCRFYINGHIFLYLVLTDVLRQGFRTQVKVGFLRVFGYDLGGHSSAQRGLKVHFA